jgi:predicted ATP-grasp superfamily ATP-dependent carboligase
VVDAVEVHFVVDDTGPHVIAVAGTITTPTTIPHRQREVAEDLTEVVPVGLQGVGGVDIIAVLALHITRFLQVQVPQGW